jgi:hypothetical protein
MRHGDGARDTTARRFDFPRCTIESIDDAIEAIRGVIELTTERIEPMRARMESTIARIELMRARIESILGRIELMRASIESIADIFDFERSKINSPTYGIEPPPRSISSISSLVGSISQFRKFYWTRIKSLLCARSSLLFRSRSQLHVARFVSSCRHSLLSFTRSIPDRSVTFVIH